MKAIALRVRSMLGADPEVVLVGSSHHPRRRHSFFLVGTFLLLGIPLAIIESIALALAIH